MLFQQAFSVDETSYVCTISELLCTAQTFRLLAGTNRRLQTQPMMTWMWGTRQIRLAAWGEPLRQHLRSCRATFNITSHHIVPLATPSSTDVYAVSRFPEAASAWTILPDRRAVPCRLTHPTMSYWYGATTSSPGRLLGSFQCRLRLTDRLDEGSTIQISLTRL